MEKVEGANSAEGRSHKIRDCSRKYPQPDRAEGARVWDLPSTQVWDQAAWEGVLFYESPAIHSLSVAKSPSNSIHGHNANHLLARLLQAFPELIHLKRLDHTHCSLLPLLG